MRPGAVETGGRGPREIVRWPGLRRILDDRQAHKAKTVVLSISNKEEAR
jgi:hypothetical protein